MMNRARLNLVLLIVAAGLGAAVYFSQEKEEKGPPLTALTPESITNIGIAHPGHAVISLEKRDGKWHLRAPVKAIVDDLEINALIGLAQTETRQKLEGANLKELGLEPPQYTIDLNQTVIAFGTVEPLQYRRYVKAGDAVYLIEDPPSAALDKDYADLVSKSLLPPAAEIERIDLPRLTVARLDDGWALKPSDPKATSDTKQKFVDGWKNARSMWNEQAKTAKPKGDLVRVTLKNGETAQFVVVEREPQFKLYSAEAGVNYVLSKALADELLKLPEPPEDTPAQNPQAEAAPEKQDKK